MPPLGDVAPAIALLALLVVVYRHPAPRVEATAALTMTAVALLGGSLSSAQVRTTTLDLLPVVGFLSTVLVVGAVCGRAGLFTAAAALLRGAGAVRLLTAALLLAAAVTAVLSLDATVVLLTPVVVAAAAARGLSPRPASYACLRMANSASLLLPVSNLTNLLALPALSLTFAGFAARMAPVLLVVLVVEYVGLRLLFRGDLRLPATPQPRATTSPEVPLVPATVVALMLVGFVATSEVGLDPWVVSTTAAVVLVGWAMRSGLVGAADVVRAAHLEFALLVLALGVVVAALAQGRLGSTVGDLVPDATSLLALLEIAVLATLLANALTNLSATLLLVPLVAPLGDTAVLAALLGLNIGAGLTLSGSLANLLWRRNLAAHGPEPSLREFHRVSLLLTPVTLVAAVVTLSVFS